MNQVISVPASGTFVYINNRDRSNYNEPAFDFTVPGLDFGSNEIRSYNAVVKQVVIRNLIPNVQQGISDAVVFSIGATVATMTDQTLIVAEGFYDALTLAATIQTFLKTIDAGFACGYDIDTRKLFITVPAGQYLQLKRPVVLAEFVFQDRLTYPSRYDRFLEMMGMITNARDGTIYHNTTFVGADPVYMGGTGFVDVNLRAGLDVMHSNGLQLDTIVRVPIRANYGEDQDYEPGLGACFQIDANYLRSLRITLTDEWGQKMSVPNNTLFSLSLLLIPIEG